MTRPLLLVALAAALAVPAAAQSCGSALARAEASYQSGDFDATISRLTACLDAGSLSSEDRRQAYRLVGLSYIGKDREADARDAVARLLEVAPNYEPDPALDPPPFVRMVEETRRRRPDLRPAASRAAVVTARGVAGSLRAHGMGYADSDGDSVGGAGGDLTLGVGLSDALAVHVQLSGSAGSGSLYDLTLGGVGLGARYVIGGGRARLAPFVGAAAAFQTATFSTAAGSGDFSGPGGEVEGGVLYALSPSLAVNGGVSAAFTSLSNDVRPDAFSATTLRVGVGLTWTP